MLDILHTERQIKQIVTQIQPLPRSFASSYKRTLLKNLKYWHHHQNSIYTRYGRNMTFASYRSQWKLFRKSSARFGTQATTSSSCARKESTNGSQKATQAQQSSSNTIQIEIKSNSNQISYFQSTANLNKYLHVILWIIAAKIAM